MQDGIRESKAAVRAAARSAVHALALEQRIELSAKAAKLLVSQEVWRAARNILFYAPLPDELDIWPLLGLALDEGKAVTLPRYDTETRAYTACQLGDLSKDIVRGQYGIREASPQCAEMDLNRLDLILVPGVAFDVQGRRLGRGKGYYDRLLPHLPGTTCGVGFDEQLLPEVPTERHDIHLNCILTPTRWIEL